MSALLQFGADVNAASAHGTTALSYAAAQGHLGVIEMLCENGAQVRCSIAVLLNVLQLSLIIIVIIIILIIIIVLLYGLFTDWPSRCPWPDSHQSRS